MNILVFQDAARYQFVWNHLHAYPHLWQTLLRISHEKGGGQFAK